MKIRGEKKNWIACIQTEDICLEVAGGGGKGGPVKDKDGTPG